MEGRLCIFNMLDRKQLKGAVRFFFGQPLLFTGAVAATSKCISICNRLFGNAHHQNNRTNAFRHALWNMLLMRNAMKMGSTVTAAGTWAEKITTWHEDLSPNAPLARAMDLHNNKTGRALYRVNFEQDIPETEQIIEALLPLLDTAVMVAFTEDLKTAKNRLVYITDQE